MRGAGGEVRSVRSLVALEGVLGDVDAVVVDLTARAYDGIGAITVVHEAGLAVLAVGQHDDVELRRRALAAGASRVHPYRRVFEDGPRVLGAWLAEVAVPSSPIEPAEPTEPTEALESPA